MLKVILISFISLIVLSGCGPSVPQPKISVPAGQGLSKNEKEKLLRLSLHKATNLGYLSYLKGNCLDDSFRSSRGTCFVTYCYLLNPVNNVVDTKYTNRCVNHNYRKYGSAKLSKRYIEEMEMINAKLPSLYKKEVVSYTNFKNDLKRQKQLRENKIKRIKINVVDKTGTLSKLVLQRINKDFHKYLKKIDYPPMKLYPSKPVISFNAPERYGRYKFSYTKPSLTNSYDKFPDNVKVGITNIEFSFMPEKVVAKNSDITISINPMYRRDNVTIVNHTNTFLTVNSISFYYAKDIVTKEVNIKLPPQSEVKSSFDIAGNRCVFSGVGCYYLKYTGQNQRVNVGIAVEYTKQNSKRNSLVVIKKVSINDF